MADRSLRFNLLWNDRDVARGADRTGRKFRDLDRDADRAGKSIGRSFDNSTKASGRFHQRLVGLGSVAGGAVVAGLGILAAGAVKLATDFDDAYDTIRIGTGKTGKDLERLKDDFRGVVKDIPTDFATASTAIAELNKRTGQTGKGLQGLAKQELELARITGTDLTKNIQVTTRLFGDWGIKTADQGRALDKLFRASQATGVGVDQLAESVVKFGAPLRQLGFSFDSSIALLAKFEKEGVNSNLVMSGMRIALGKLAKAGKDPQQGFLELAQKIKDAGSAAAANKIAIEVFGQRAGPDMAAAIREGRLSIRDLQTQIANGKDTILGAAKDAEDFGEKWQRLVNKVKLMAEPVVTAGLDTLSTKAGSLESFVSDKLIPRLGALKTAWDDNKDAILGLLDPFDSVNAKSKTADERAQSLADSLTTATEGMGKIARGLNTVERVLNETLASFQKAGSDIHVHFVRPAVRAFLEMGLSFAKVNQRMIAGAATVAEALHLPQAKALRRAEQSMGRFVAEARGDLDRMAAEAAAAASKVPGGGRSKFGSNLGRAGDQMGQFRTDFNRNMDRLHGKQVSVTARFGLTQTEAVAKFLQTTARGRAAGGPITGPGTGTSDSIPAIGPGGTRYRLSNNEHVWTAQEVRNAGGHVGVERLRQQFRATGGPIGVGVKFRGTGLERLAPQVDRFSAALSSGLSHLVKRFQAAMKRGEKLLGGMGKPGVTAFIRSTDPLPYIWGAAGPGGYDCSGLASAVYGKHTGRGGGRGQRYFTTSSISATGGLRPGLGGVLEIGVTSGSGHMAGRYGGPRGLGFEAESSRTGIKIGSAASRPESFARHFTMARGGPVEEVAAQLASFLGADVGGDPGRLRIDGKVFDRGGYLMPGTTIAHNRTGRPERVVPPGPQTVVLDPVSVRALAREFASIVQATPMRAYMNPNDARAGIREAQRRAGYPAREQLR